MFKKMESSPHTHSGKLTARIMLWVIAAMLPALLTQILLFWNGCFGAIRIGYFFRIIT